MEKVARKKWEETKRKAFDRVRDCIIEHGSPREALEWLLVFTTLDDNEHRVEDYES